MVFNNLQLADGRRHRLLLRLTNLHRGSGSVELFLDCTRVDSIQLVQFWVSQKLLDF